MHPAEMNIAITVLSGAVPQTGSLEERLLRTYQYARQHADALFFMSPPNDDNLFKAATAYVMMKSTPDELERMTRSAKPLLMLSAAMSGVPVDFSQMPTGDDMIPLMGLWTQSAP